jgi:hypothetical protein
MEGIYKVKRCLHIIADPSRILIIDLDVGVVAPASLLSIAPHVPRRNIGVHNLDRYSKAPEKDRRGVGIAVAVRPAGPEDLKGIVRSIEKVGYIFPQSKNNLLHRLLLSLRVPGESPGTSADKGNSTAFKGAHLLKGAFTAHPVPYCYTQPRLTGSHLQVRDHFRLAPVTVPCRKRDFTGKGLQRYAVFNKNSSGRTGNDLLAVGFVTVFRKGGEQFLIRGYQGVAVDHLSAHNHRFRSGGSRADKKKRQDQKN